MSSLLFFFSVCWQHLKVFFQNIVSWDETWTKAQKKWLFAYSQKRGQQTSITETRKKKWISTRVLCCFFIVGNTKSLFLLCLTFCFLKRKLHRLKLKRIRTFCYWQQNRKKNKFRDTQKKKIKFVIFLWYGPFFSVIWAFCFVWYAFFFFLAF